MVRTALFLFLLALPATAQQITNESVFLGKEGPSPLRRNDVRAIGKSSIRWENRAVHPIDRHHSRQDAHSHVVVARWDPKACVTKRGPFCTQRGGWAMVGVLNAREVDVEQLQTGDEEGHYLIFARSRQDPSAPDAWQLDRLIVDEVVDEPAGGRRLIFDASATIIGSKVRYSVIVVPLAPK